VEEKGDEGRGLRGGEDKMEREGKERDRGRGNGRVDIAGPD